MNVSRPTCLMWPARLNASENSYNARLAIALEDQGWKVSEFSFLGAAVGRYEVLHIHWPEGILKSRRGLRAAAAVAAQAILLSWVRFVRRRQIVWTVHNLRPHMSRSPRCERILYAIVPRLVHSLVYLSAASQLEAERLYPPLTNRQACIIPIGRYHGEFLPTEGRAKTRRLLGLDHDGHVVAYVGTSEPYKGPDALLAIASELPSSISIVIAGRVPKTNWGRDLIDAAGLLGDRCRLIDRWLEPTEMADIIAAADLVVYPFRQVTNSSSVLVPPELGTKVLAPRLGSLPEVATRVGTSWIRLYVPPLTASDIRDALEAATDAPPPFTGMSWTEIGHDTIAAYRSSREGHG